MPHQSIIQNSSLTVYNDFTLGTYWNNSQNGVVPANLTLLYEQSGVQELTLAFITTDSSSACEGAWGGYSEYSVKKAWGVDDIAEFISQGGTVTLSFGGAVGTYLENSCEDVPSLVAALQNAISTYQVNQIDFDIEGANLQNKISIQRLASALVILQQKNPNLSVSVTLPVLPTGLTDDGIAALNIFAQTSVELRYVNIMAMDYGASAAPNPGNMGNYAIDALNATHTQLAEIYPNHSPQSLWSRLAVTPMIGINDVWNYPPGEPERFTLQDAQKLNEFCKTQGCQIRYWSLNSDHPCQQEYASNACSGAFNGTQMQTQDYQFAQTFLMMKLLGVTQFISQAMISGNDVLPIGTTEENAMSQDVSSFNLQVEILACFSMVLIATIGCAYLAARYGQDAKNYVTKNFKNMCSDFWKRDVDNVSESDKESVQLVLK